MNIIIAVCTFKRQEYLKHCLNSIQSLTIPSSATLDVLVVDNEPSQITEAICSDYYVTYIPEPQRGLSYARNKVLEYARSQKADYLGIIDDDETVSKTWFVELLKSIQDTQADAVSGPINIIAPDNIPQYLINAYQFKSVKTYTTVKTLPMGNILLGKKTLDAELWFNTEYNFTGGEDIDFFNRATQLSIKLVKSPIGVVTEYLVPEKASLKAFYQRQYRVAQTHYAQKYPRKIFKYYIECVLSIFELLCAVLLIPITFFIDKFKIKSLKLIAKSLGRVTSHFGKRKLGYGN